MRVAVLGPTGLGGSYTAKELIDRGHDVVGISRSPEKLGSHQRYKPEVLDLVTANITEIAKALDGFDCVVNAFNPPPTEGLYRLFVEVSRKIVLASKIAKVPYLISIGGTGSLFLPGQQPLTACDDPRFWVAFRRSVADSEPGVAMMEFRLPQIGPFFRQYRDARLARKSGNASKEQSQFISELESGIISQGGNAPGDLPTAARATFSFYDGNESFRWSFVSPPAQYRPGKRTGSYTVHFDEVPLSSEDHAEADNIYAGRLLGISAADLAVAIADEAEQQKKVGRHWSAVADLVDDASAPNVANL